MSKSKGTKMIELGRKVKCKVTGFEGFATARIEFLNGCMQILVQPEAVTPKKGSAMEYPAAVYIDIEQLVHVGRKKVLTNPRKVKPPSGGVRQHP